MTIAIPEITRFIQIITPSAQAALTGQHTRVPRQEMRSQMPLANIQPHTP